jgi:carboxyl-terminal processing protease
VLLPVMLVAGIYIGGHPNSLPGSVRKLLVSEPSSRVVDEGISLVQSDYYRKIPASQLNDASLAGVVSSLHDPFSNYFSASAFRAFNDPEHGRRFAGVGMNVQHDPRGLRVLNVFPGTPAAGGGIAAGDVIVAVNGRSLRGLSSAAASNLIKGTVGTKVSLTVLDGRHRFTHHFRRAEVAVPVVTSSVKTVDGHRLGVVSLASFSQGSHAEVRQAVDHVLEEHAQGLVFDLRENGGGLLNEAVLIASIFIQKGTIVSTSGRDQPRQVYTAVGNAIASSIPMVVLVDGDTASSSEIVTAALQDHHRATVVGTHTFGKGVFQELEPLSNGGAMDITVGEYFTPNGRNLGGGGVKRGAGVSPDVKVSEPLGAGGRDVQLDTALRVLAHKLR